MSDDIRSLIEIQDRSFERAGPGLRESFPRNVVMDASRMAEFLDGKRYAVLAPARRDGRPHAAPIQEYTAAGPADPRFAEDWRLRHGTDPRWAVAMLELRPERVFSFDGTRESADDRGRDA